MRAAFLLALVPFLGASASSVTCNSATTNTRAVGIKPATVAVNFTTSQAMTATTITICSAIFANTTEPTPVTLAGTTFSACAAPPATVVANCLTVDLAGCGGNPAAVETVIVTVTNATLLAVNPAPSGTAVNFTVSTGGDTDAVTATGWTTLACTCTNGQSDNAACATSVVESCASCSNGYHTTGSPATCATNACTCPGGVAVANGTTCPEHGAEYCTSCSAGFTANNTISGRLTCPANVCTCKNGTGVTSVAGGLLCTGTMNCSTCDSPLLLYADPVSYERSCVTAYSPSPSSAMGVVPTLGLLLTGAFWALAF